MQQSTTTINPLLFCSDSVRRTAGLKRQSSLVITLDPRFLIATIKIAVAISSRYCYSGRYCAAIRYSGVVLAARLRYCAAIVTL
jgi:hypothetical protein